MTNTHLDVIIYEIGIVLRPSGGGMPFDFTIYDNEHPALSTQGIENLVTYVYPYRIDLVQRFTQEEEKLWDLLSTLPSKDCYCLVELNGLFTGKKLTLKAVGDVVGLSRERIRQVCARASAKLRHPMFDVIAFPVPPPLEMNLRAWGEWPCDHLSWMNQQDYAKMFGTQKIDTFGDLAKLTATEIREMFALFSTSNKNAVLFLQTLQDLEIEIK